MQVRAGGGVMLWRLAQAESKAERACYFFYAAAARQLAGLPQINARCSGGAAEAKHAVELQQPAGVF